VLDEADRMLDMGFLPAIKRVLGKLPAQRQTLLFSATFEAQIKALALEIHARSASGAGGRAEHHRRDHRPSRARGRCRAQARPAGRISSASATPTQCIVFGRTKHGCNRLAEQLEESGLAAVAIHGNKSQAQRQKALRDFKAGKARVLVATDVAARGLDIPNLPLVINYDLPMVAEDYVHRIGRTGRNGATGEALSLVAPEEGGLLRQIQRMLKADVELEVVAGFESSRPIQLNAPLPKPVVARTRARARPPIARTASRPRDTRMPVRSSTAAAARAAVRAAASAADRHLGDAKRKPGRPGLFLWIDGASNACRGRAFVSKDIGADGWIPAFAGMTAEIPPAGGSSAGKEEGRQCRPSSLSLTTGSALLRRDPAIDLAFQHGQRHRAVLQHFGVELAHVELRAQFLLGLGAQLLDLQLADLVSQRLPRPGDVALRLGGGLGIALGRVVAHVLDHLLARPALAVQARVGDQADRTPQLVLQVAEVVVRIGVHAQRLAQRFGVQAPTFAEGAFAAPAAERRQVLQLDLQCDLEVMARMASCRYRSSASQVLRVGRS
jgi:xanthosine utilization system XapX-like protein